ncbi:hypothetical protein [Nostocoides sp. HKS02]|uniref:hypothetical protein n=1 Tax=Nostocoides sp. HKS02 TaxID=1813880 RepID=UPI0012B4F8FB|nr:hypothetical protein [Tetrasphaera sp. HKS02]QGN58894.1 hypothetical protein GKE56_14485 [Tetrasphaera sp. HKS02]
MALLVAAAVPTGFLIYQLYFYLHSRVEGVIFQFVHEDVGLKVLTDLGLGDQAVQSNWFTVARPGLYLRFPRGASIPLTGETNSLWLQEPSNGPLLGYARAGRRRALAEYRRCRERNWQTLETAINTRPVADEKARERAFANLDRLADIYHTLGATKLALATGWFAGVVWLWSSLDPMRQIRARDALALTLGAAVTAVGLGVMAMVLHENRRHCLKRRITALEDACRL